MKKTMRECNVCGNKHPNWMYKTANKKTCRHCEYRWYYSLLRRMVKQRKLSPVERIANRLGYMGSGFIMMSPYLITYDKVGYVTYTIGALLSIPQIWVGKQWNVVIVNINLLIGYGTRLFT